MACHRTPGTAVHAFAGVAGKTGTGLPFTVHAKGLAIMVSIGTPLLWSLFAAFVVVALGFLLPGLVLLRLIEAGFEELGELGRFFDRGDRHHFRHSEVSCHCAIRGIRRAGLFATRTGGSFSAKVYGSPALSSPSSGLVVRESHLCTTLEPPALGQAEARDARALGFKGKSCIHPTQVPVAVKSGLANVTSMEEPRTAADSSSGRPRNTSPAVRTSFATLPFFLTG